MGMVVQNLGAAEYKAYIEKTAAKYEEILKQLGVI